MGSMDKSDSGDTPGSKSAPQTLASIITPVQWSKDGGQKNPDSLRPQESAEDIAFPTSLQRHVSTPGAFAVVGIGCEDSGSSVSEPYDHQEQEDFEEGTNEAHIVSAMLVDEGENQGTSPRSSFDMEEEKAVVVAERLGWSPKRWLFWTLLSLVVILVGISTILAIGVGKNTSTEVSKEAKKCSVATIGNLEQGFPRAIRANNFALWGVRETGTGVSCLKAQPRAVISCLRDGNMTILAQDNTECTASSAQIGKEFVCSTPQVGLARIIYQCVSDAVKIDNIRGVVRLTGEEVEVSDECQRESGDLTFVSAGLFCRSREVAEAKVPITRSSCRDGFLYSEPIAPYDLDVCVDDHRNTTIQLEMASDHRKSTRRAVLDQCLVRPECQPSLGDLNVSF